VWDCGWRLAVGQVGLREWFTPPKVMEGLVAMERNVQQQEKSCTRYLVLGRTHRPSSWLASAVGLRSMAVCQVHTSPERCRIAKECPRPRSRSSGGWGRGVYILGRRRERTTAEPAPLHPGSPRDGWRQTVQASRATPEGSLHGRRMPRGETQPRAVPWRANGTTLPSERMARGGQRAVRPLASAFTREHGRLSPRRAWCSS
jgi:hypothetical protein